MADASSVAPVHREAAPFKKSENLASKEVRQVIEEGKLIPINPWQAVEHEKLAAKTIRWPSKKETSSQKMTGKSPKKES